MKQESQAKTRIEKVTQFCDTFFFQDKNSKYDKMTLGF